MTFDEFRQYILSGNELKIGRAYTFLYKKKSSNIQYYLRHSYGLKHEHDFFHCFDDAFLELETTIITGSFKGQTILEIVSFLKTTARNFWTRHPNNPKRITEVAMPDFLSFDTPIYYDALTAQEKDKLAKKTNEFIKSLDSLCQRLLSYLPVFNPPNVKKITHQEIAEEEGFANALASRHGREDCKNNLEQAIRKELNQNLKLKEIINKLFDI